MSKMITPYGTIMFPKLATAVPRSEEKEPAFSVKMVFTKEDDLSIIESSIDNAIAKKFPKGAPHNFRRPLRKGEDNLKQDGTYSTGIDENSITCEFWRYERFGKIPCVDSACVHIEPSEVYSGVKGRVFFDVFVYDEKGNTGACLGLKAVQSTGEGEPIGYVPPDPIAVFSEADDDNPLG